MPLHGSETQAHVDVGGNCGRERKKEGVFVRMECILFGKVGGGGLEQQ